ncbi:MAG: TatD family hydrolase [Patescibacteria group bacterium]|nr:TatD family hydrolase [Patescibacteria group bacterium]
MELIDTHSHIQSAGGLDTGERSTREIWAKDPEITAESLLSGAAEHGVSKIICVGCDLTDSKLAIDFAQAHENCWASIGVHPHEAKEYVGKADALEQFAALVSQPKVVAIGECGFDFHYNHSPKEDQAVLLHFQLELAKKHNLPVIFHVREAYEDFWPIFDNYPGIRGVLHSFTDTIDTMHEAVGRGLFIGVNGIATFAKKPEQLAMYSQIPLKNMVLETDAPFLTPTPYRGTINQPKRLGNVADFLSKLRSEDRSELAATTTANARALFGI